MDVADVPHDRLGCRVLDAQVVQRDPSELHCLHREKECDERHILEAPLENQCRRGVINCEHTHIPA
jgi:hypothetical protein